MPKVILAVDPGASQTKSIYLLESQSSKSLLLMESEVFKVSATAVNEMEIDYGKPEDRVWLKTKKGGKK